jgi:hypothetical protein
MGGVTCQEHPSAAIGPRKSMLGPDHLDEGDTPYFYLAAAVSAHQRPRTGW